MEAPLGELHRIDQTRDKGSSTERRLLFPFLFGEEEIGRLLLFFLSKNNGADFSKKYSRKLTRRVSLLLESKREISPSVASFNHR